MRSAGCRFALFALGLFWAGAFHPASAQSSQACVDPRVVEALPPAQKRMVEEMAASYRDSTCRNDECEFRVEPMADGKTLVKMRARRFAPRLQACVTVYMSELAALFDADGRAIDLWRYCLLMAHEATLATPSFTPDPLPYKHCLAAAP